MSSIAASIQTQLQHIERAEGVRVLFAGEAGSRAWGFPSADSDYDVRFIYLRPLDWYLTIDPGRDVIERPIDASLDITGWDLKKALQLLRKSNPPLMEWLHSPYIYWEQTTAAARMRSLAPAFHAPTLSSRHYLGMARRSWLAYQQKGATLKMLFYTLRALLAVDWIAQGRGVAPTEFSHLVEALLPDPALRALIDSLARVKATSTEKDSAVEAGPVERWVDCELDRWQVEPVTTGVSGGDPGDLDRLFRELLREVWGR